MDSSLETIIEAARARLSDRGYRWTQPRGAIIMLLARARKPRTAEEIFNELGSSGCDLVTVYRVLWTFEDVGLVSRHFQHNGTAAFEILKPKPLVRIFDPVPGTWDQLSQEDSEKLQNAAEPILTKLRALGYQNVTALIQFFATQK